MKSRRLRSACIVIPGLIAAGLFGICAGYGSMSSTNFIPTVLAIASLESVLNVEAADEFDKG